MVQFAHTNEGREASARGALSPSNATFVVVSFEGPDPYSQAGGLGVRVSGLVDTLARLEYETHLFFIGDPSLPGEERSVDDRLVLHRWSQWISANCPAGVYDGEESKAADLAASLPAYVIDHVMLPAIGAGRIPIVLFEEWQTAACVCRVAAMLSAAGLRDNAILAWNANNPYGFDRIDWPRLAASATVTTISRHMKSLIRARGVDAQVFPNGIADAWFEPVSRAEVSRVRAALDRRPGAGFLFKMARWEREKGWLQALDAIHYARARRATDERRIEGPVLIARSGGPTGRGAELTHEAELRGLHVVAIESEREFESALADVVTAGADVVDLRFGVTPALARTLYAACDGVLANSVSEPFGLVGLEAMAAGGIAFTGGTGEDYAVGGRNAVVLETLDPEEILARWLELTHSAALVARLRRAARKTAHTYEWRRVAADLIDALSRPAQHQRLLI